VFSESHFTLSTAKSTCRSLPMLDAWSHDSVVKAFGLPSPYRSFKRGGCGLLTCTIPHADIHNDGYQPHRLQSKPETVSASCANTTLISACQTTQTCVSFVDAPASPALLQAQPTPMRLFGLFLDTTIAQTSYKKQKNGSCPDSNRGPLAIDDCCRP
jgi:hypothetical protein